MKLADILAIADAATFANALISFVNDKQIEHGFESLTPAEQTVLLANDCEYRIVNGGITKVLLSGNDWRNAMIASLAEIGAMDAHRILSAGARLFDAVPPEEAEAAMTVGDQIALAGEAQVDALDAELSARGCEGEIGDRLCAYVVAHRARFRPE